jgi:hypothetical protein
MSIVLQNKRHLPQKEPIFIARHLENMRPLTHGYTRKTKSHFARNSRTNEDEREKDNIQMWDCITEQQPPTSDCSG